jgi:hypothetical protein
VAIQYQGNLRDCVDAPASTHGVIASRGAAWRSSIRTMDCRVGFALRNDGVVVPGHRLRKLLESAAGLR